MRDSGKISLSDVIWKVAGRLIQLFQTKKFTKQMMFHEEEWKKGETGEEICNIDILFTLTLKR